MALLTGQKGQPQLSGFSGMPYGSFEGKTPPPDAPFIAGRRVAYVKFEERTVLVKGKRVVE